VGWKITKIEKDEKTGERCLLLVNWNIPKGVVRYSDIKDINYFGMSSNPLCMTITESQLSALVDVIDPNWRKGDIE